MMIPKPENTVLSVIDVQEKLLTAIPALQLPRVELLIKGCQALGIRSLVTEQYPQGLGPTTASIRELYPAEEWAPIAKGSFSCMLDEVYAKKIGELNPKTVILCGVESHVCVQQTAFDLLERGCQVIIPTDAVASRHDFDREAALRLMIHSGVCLTTVESLLFMLLRTSKHPAFKTISKLVR